MVDEHRARRGREPSVLSAGLVAGVGLGLVALVVFVVAATWFLYVFLADAEPGAAAVRAPASPPSHLELEALRARERDRLNGYGWVDRDAGVVRVPVERAMGIWLDRGAPANPFSEDSR